MKTNQVQLSLIDLNYWNKLKIKVQSLQKVEILYTLLFTFGVQYKNNIPFEYVKFKRDIIIFYLQLLHLGLERFVTYITKHSHYQCAS